MNKELIINKGQAVLSALKNKELRQVFLIAMVPIVVLALYNLLPNYLREDPNFDQETLVLNSAGASSPENEELSSDKIPDVKDKAEDSVLIKIDVSGAVVNPGLFEMSAGDRVADAIKSAGGLGPNADRHYISQALNLAQKLNDGDKIYLPSYYDVSIGLPAPSQLNNKVGDPLPVLAASRAPEGRGDEKVDKSSDNEDADANTNDQLVNINTASKTELDSLPGIGEKYAEYIINNRPYTSKSDICSEEVIKNSTTCEAIQDLITI